MKTTRSLAFFLLASAAMLSLPGEGFAAKYLVYFGTYTGPKSKGIYVSQFDTATGKLDPPTVAAEIDRPSWVTLHPNGKFLYAVTEIGSGGQGEATISSFAIDHKTGTLQFLNKVPSGGGGACHLAINKAGNAIVVANYGTGSTAAFRLEPDGKIGERTGFIQHSGSGPDQRRQKGPHAHAVVFSPDYRFVFVPDLGQDKVLSYKFDAATGGLAPNDPPSASVPPAGGPRHFAFAPSHKYAYAINEMGSRVTTFTFNGAAGSLTPIQTISTLDEGFKGENNSAEIEVDQKGRFVYASNRGDDSITVFSIDPKTGQLTKVQRAASGGKVPRSFKIDPTGKYLLSANQGTNNVAVFKIGSDGQLTPTGQTIEVGAPVCVTFLKP
jgi:6-phosphogluconolactonase